MPRLRSLLLILLLIAAFSAQLVHASSHVDAVSADDCTLCLHSQSSHPTPTISLAAPLFTLLPLPLPAPPALVVTLAPRYRCLARAPPLAALPAITV